MSAIQNPAAAEQPALRSARLRQASAVLHDQLEHAVGAHAPFESRESYGRFLQMQYLFQSELKGLYNDPELNQLFPDLASRCRADAALADLNDLGLAVPAAVPGALIAPNRATALTWIRVSEGSKLGAAILIKRAEAMGLSETFGARHLAEPEGGRMRGWKAFNAIFDALPFTPTEEADADQAAVDAFSRLQILLQHTYSAHA
ncbi:biliverdin-producing heme oxygenase [Pseudomonas eucalypticola]|uniref:Biliverdin-producing heme oxygenase n=1 Tax=Pseudomonas eucalypticola TaxID=2599595 RepID=A0A7D5HUV0_9PSED|nr:biliverdin-producing heme oxygenase [Pseudomonas eucalypticola]QKZ03231.1 biliverdin-producing heme oxygenase [Pseudomonas eucalypticola]